MRCTFHSTGTFCNSTCTACDRRVAAKAARNDRSSRIEAQRLMAAPTGR